MTIVESIRSLFYNRRLVFNNEKELQTEIASMLLAKDWLEKHGGDSAAESSRTVISDLPHRVENDKTSTFALTN